MRQSITASSVMRLWTGMVITTSPVHMVVTELGVTIWSEMRSFISVIALAQILNWNAQLSYSRDHSPAHHKKMEQIGTQTQTIVQQTCISLDGGEVLQLPLILLSQLA